MVYLDWSFIIFSISQQTHSHGTQSDEEEESDEDDEGECQVCEKGGDLIVCDGGDNVGGCGHMYHVHCVGRDMIPPGKSEIV